MNICSNITKLVLPVINFQDQICMINLYVVLVEFLSIVTEIIAMEKVQLIHNYYIFIIISNFNIDINLDTESSKQ